MARLVTSGFELHGFDGAGGVDGLNTASGGGATTIDTTHQRSGSACLKCVTTAGSQVAESTWNVTTAAGNTMYFRVWFLFSSTAIADFPISIFNNTSPFVSLQTNSSAQLVLFAGTSNSTWTQQGSGVAIPSDGKWHRVDISVLVPAAGNGTVSFSLDGVSIVGPTTLNIGTSVITGFDAGNAFSGGASTYYIDDIAVNDSTAGGSETGVPAGGLAGGKIVLLTPSSDNSRTGFTTGAGGTTNLFAATDNTPPLGVAQASGTATSQIQDNTSNTTDNYVANLQTYTGAGVPAGSTVTLVQAIANIGNSSTTSRNLGIQSTANPVIAEVTGGTGATAAAAWPTGWTTIKTAYSYAPTVTLSSNPTLEIRKATASTDYAMASLLGMLTEYTPPSSGWWAFF